MKPLSGITVIALEHAIAAPFCSRQLADQYARHFLQDDPSPGVELEYEMAGRFVPEITLADVNDLAKTWLPKTNRAW